MTHIPVLLREAVEFLDVKPGGIYVDGTVGLGGHAEKILGKLGESGLLVGIDCDEDALEEAREKLKKYGERARLFKGNYLQLPEFLKTLNVPAVDGILLDVGVSSLQLRMSGRGFSFQEDGPLDMRMSRTYSLTAEKIVNSFPKDELENIFREYGEERYARNIAGNIARRRQSSPYKSTLDLAGTVKASVRPSNKSRIHPATRVFQALRIYINNELDNLKQAVDSFPELLKPGGRFAVITFHSLEDRIVKRAFAQHRKNIIYRILTRKPVTPGPEEQGLNPNSRSAKIRAMEKL